MNHSFPTRARRLFQRLSKGLTQMLSRARPKWVSGTRAKWVSRTRAQCLARSNAQWFGISSIGALLVGASAFAHAQPALYTIDPSHTFVTFEAKHMGASTSRGRWDKKDGQITLDKTAKTGRAEITLEMGSISTGVGPFDGRLKSEDFFDVAKFPTAKFIGTTFKFEGDKIVEVLGELTLLGKTNPVTLKATSAFTCYTNTRIQREVCGGDFDTTIQRSLWGMTNGLANNTIPDSVRLVIQIEAIKTQ